MLLIYSSSEGCPDLKWNIKPFFVVTEEAHAVILAYAANGGGLPWRDNTGI